MSDSLSIKTALALGLLGLCIASPYGSMSLVEARPPSLSPQTEQKRTDTNSEEQSPSNAKNHTLNSINQSWLAEIQSRSAKQNSSVKQQRALGQTPPEPAKQNTPLKEEEESTEAPAYSTEKLYLANPGNAQVKEEAAQASTAFKQEQRKTQPQEAPSFSSAALRFVLFISLLGLLLYFGLRFFRLRNQGLFRRGEDLVQVVISVPLVQGKFLQVVDVAGHLLVLGVSDAGVQLLTNINEGISADRIRLWQSRQSPQAPPNKMLDKLTSIIKGTDLNFRNTQAKQNFGSLLKQLSGQPEKAEETDKAAELKRLLMRQKRELSKKNN